MAKKKKTGLDLLKMKGEAPKKAIVKKKEAKKKKTKKRKPVLAKQKLKNRDDLIDSYLVAIDGAQLLGGHGMARKIRGVLSTQAPGLNAAIGRGGIPLGRLSILAGAEGSGKTTLALHLAAQCQAQGGVVIYVDTEYKLDPDYAQSIGVDTKRLVILQPPHLEDVFMAGEHVIEQAKKYRIDVGVRIPILFIQDSMNSSISKAEYEGEHGDDFYSPQARVYSKSLPKFMPKVSKEDIALFFLGQQRKKIGVVFGDDFSLIGGSAPKHYSSLIMRIKRIGSVKKDNQQVASRVVIECVKNQIAPPFRKTECLIEYGKGINPYHSLIFAALELGIIEKDGAWYSYKGKQLGQGLMKSAVLLKKNRKLFEKIEKRLYKKAFVKSAK